MILFYRELERLSPSEVITASTLQKKRSASYLVLYNKCLTSFRYAVLFLMVPMFLPINFEEIKPHQETHVFKSFSQSCHSLTWNQAQRKTDKDISIWKGPICRSLVDSRNRWTWWCTLIIGLNCTQQISYSSSHYAALWLHDNYYSDNVVTII